MTPKPTDTIIITPGYRPGILARTLEMHLDYYYQLCGWGRQFEAVLSQGMGDLLARLGRPVNQVWSAVLTSPAPLPTPTPGPGPGPDQITTPPPTGATPYTALPAEGKIVGVVYIDGECIGEQGVARLRCFIVDESVRGMGVGRKLLDSAMEFVRHVGFREVRLSTMRSLAAARRLYESYGFVAAGEEWFEEFGNGVWEMKYVWRSTES
jgi:ribosomal protein S18 acetylase RimI-like enzyme